LGIRNEETAIILEDDCIPTEEFFIFCAEELKRHESNPKVMQISGNCFVSISLENSNKYYFSALNDIWGWATWKRAWDQFERIVPDSQSVDLKRKVEQYFQDRNIARWFTRYVAEARHTNSQVWSTHWTLTLINNGGLTIVPQRNLVRNIGFVGDATHMTDAAFEIYQKFETGPIQSSSLPSEVRANRILDSERFSIIMMTDLNLRRKSLALGAARRIALTVLPTHVTKYIRALKRNIL